MTTPPTYPRIPHLVPGRGTSDDRALGDVDSELLLSKPVVVEEKLDGANVAVWLEDGRIECALRSGPGGQDRAGQLGPLRAWLGQRTDDFRDLLAGRALYAEWLYLSHAIRYDRLPAYLVGFDLWSPDKGFVAPVERSERAAAAGLAVPPELYRGVLDGLDVAESLLGDSRVGVQPMEGIVIRTLDAVRAASREAIECRVRADIRHELGEGPAAQSPQRPPALVALSNRERIGRAFDALASGFGGYLQERLPGLDSDNDPSAQLRLVADRWDEAFRGELTRADRNLVFELREVRNRWAQNQSFTADDAYRVLDSIERLLVAVGAPEAVDVGRSKDELMRQRYDAEARKTESAVDPGPSAGLTAWREVVQPHDDVAAGRFALAEFAADLYQVREGEGRAEYVDPAEFFRRTYLTAGLRRLLAEAVERATGHGGSPVVDLQTNFGGGKTHSMIALYHLFSGIETERFPDELRELLAELGADQLPEVRRVVLVGNQLRPGQPDTKPDGTTVQTMWGELAWQLGAAEGYAFVADADRTRTSPGDALRDLLRRYSPCLVLIDEWVAYARQLYADDTLPAGTFDTHFSFAQALTESARAVEGVLLVVSIPASEVAGAGIGSDIEVGGVGGREALRRLRAIVGRMESSWRPASAEESFEIVRRRLFQPLEPSAMVARDATCLAFGDFYRTNAAEFPVECREPAYVDRMKAAYPIHPELFDRLYEDWSTLERFQRTRGVLRLMASVIHALWVRGDQSAMILPASVPLDDTAVVSELDRNLDDNWKPIIDTDVDGPASLPRVLDDELKNLGRYGAARRVARTVFLASAPKSGSPHRGVEATRIRLGCALPGQVVAVYGDALNRLSDRATYLYVESARYWYGTQPGVARLARDRTERYETSAHDAVVAGDRNIARRTRPMTTDASVASAPHAILARIERLPASRSLLKLIVLIAIGGWFEFYELFMPGAVSLGLVHDRIFAVKASGLFDFHSFPSFLASFFAGMFISTILFSRLSDLLGRRTIFIWSMAVYSLFNLLIVVSSSPGWIDLFRFFAGVGVGIQLINNDSFMAEITPRYLRGRYMALAIAIILTAVPVSAFLGMLLVPYAPFGISGWRWVVLVGALGGILVWLVQRGLPESPRWLESRGRVSEADEALRKIEAEIEREVGSLPLPSANIIEAPTIQGDWREMFQGRYLGRTVALSIFQFCQTIAVYGFTSWVPIILVERGYNVVHSLQYTFLILLLTPIGGLLGAYFAERFERKWQLVLTAIGIAVFGFSFALSTDIVLIVASGVLVTLCNNWLISVFHPYAAELFPTRIRALAVGFSFSWSRVSAIFVGYWVSAILAGVGQIGVFVMIGTAMLLIVVTIGFFGPRTNGQRLEEISP